MPRAPLLFLLLLLVTAAVEAAGQKYIVVLQSPKDAQFEERVVAAGGTITAKWRDRRIIVASDEAVVTIAADASVRYVQPVSEGAPQLPHRAERLQPRTDGITPTWDSGEYLYDASGNIRAIGHGTSPNADGKTNTYTYDAHGRLTSSTVNHAANHTQSYSYDAFGNLVSITTDGVTQTLQVQAATNRMTNGTYDAAGNLLTDGIFTPGPEHTRRELYGYDGLGKVIDRTVDGSHHYHYIYDAADERIATRRTGTNIWRWTLRGFDGKVLREFEASLDISGGLGSATPWLWVEDYVYRNGTLTAAERSIGDGGVRYFHTDHLGTPRIVTGANAVGLGLHHYYAFGAEQTGIYQEKSQGLDRPEPMRFTGHERDFIPDYGSADESAASYVDYMHARFYDPNKGRFLSVDPGKDWDPAKPQSWNMYSYVRNNPINHTDPTGKWLDTVVDVVDLGVGVVDMWRSTLRGEAVSARQNLAVAASVVGIITPGATGLGSAVRHADDVADGAKALKGARKVDFVVTESGTAIPVSQSRMKEGFDAAGFPNKPTRAPGTEYTLPDQSKVRTMEPSGTAPRRASFENRNGQPVDPNIGKPPQPPPGLTPAQRKQWVRERTHVEQKP